MKHMISMILLVLVGCGQQESPPEITKFAAATSTGTCADVAKPEWPVTFDENNFQIQPPVRAVPGRNNLWDASEERDFVPARNPVYPDHCWELGWVPHTKIRHAPDLPSVHEPVYRQGEGP